MVRSLLDKRSGVHHVVVVVVLMPASLGADHDRKWDFNWRTTAGGRLLTWDSGLAFRHGPIGSRSCLDILCGTTEWRELNNNRLRSNVCQRIVRFRRSTIAKLRAMSWLARTCSTAPACIVLAH